MSRLADYGKFDNLDDGSDEDVKPQRRDAPPPPGTEPGPARFYKRVQVGCVIKKAIHLFDHLLASCSKSPGRSPSSCDVTGK